MCEKYIFTSFEYGYNAFWEKTKFLKILKFIKTYACKFKKRFLS